MMQKLRMTLVAAALTAVGAVIGAGLAQADLAASQTRIPGVQALGGSAVQPADWVIYVRYHNGCNRQRWCATRYWNGYKYLYSNCYWGACVYGGSSGGGYRGGY